MIPDLPQLAATVGPTGAVLLFMWLNRSPSSRDKAADPIAALAAKLNSIESRVIDVQADMKVLMDRKPR